MNKVHKGNYGDCHLYYNKATHLLSCGYKKNVIGGESQSLQMLRVPPFYEIFDSGSIYKTSNTVIRHKISGSAVMIITWDFYLVLLDLRNKASE